jgi:rhamnulokinase
MPSTVRVAAVDLGATSGRVVAATVAQDRLALEEVHRFPNGPVRVSDGSLRWDIRRLFDEIVIGLAKAGPVDGIGVDSWAIDYGLLDRDGRLLASPFSYRDQRTERFVDHVRNAVGARELYATTGIQHLPFNTIFQLAAETDLSAASALLLIPDLVCFWLTGSMGAEETNASTTQLYDIHHHAWAVDILRAVGLPECLLPPLRKPGTVIGELLPAIRGRAGQRPGTHVVAVGSHDTASAFVAVPAAADANAAIISSGTWSLVGFELNRAIVTEASRQANFTNEVGIDGTVCFLRNVMGLWVLNEAMTSWRDDDMARLMREASAAPAHGAVIDVDAPEFVSPGDMEQRIRQACARTGQRPPEGKGAIVRTVLESLALAYRRTIRCGAQLAGRSVDVVHVVGGGSQNGLLCQLTADACGAPVHAGPVEAAALGNALVQARALGVDLPDLAAMRQLVRRTHEPIVYEPSGDNAPWEQAEARLQSASSARPFPPIE